MNNSVKKSAIIITIMTLIYKLIGFLKEVLLAYFYGTGEVVDAYVMALTIPTVLFGWLSSLSVPYVPFYYELEKKSKVQQYTDSIITMTTIFSCICIAVGELFAPWIIKMCAPGYTGERYSLTLSFFRIYLCGFMFLPLYKIYVSLVKCKKAYVSAIIPDLFNSLTVIAVIIMSHYAGSSFLMYGNLLAVIIQFLTIAALSRRLGYRYKFGLSEKKNVQKTIITALPIFFSSMLVQINLFVDRFFASKLDTGSLAALNYGEIIKDFVYYLGSIAILTIIFPLMAEKVSDNKMDEVEQILKRGFGMTIVFFIPLQFGIAFFGRQAVELIFQRGMFSTNSSEMTSNALIYYSIGLLTLVINAICNNLYYSLKKTKYAFFTSFGSVILNILFNFILVERYNYIGLAFSTSLASILILPINIILIHKILPGLKWRGSLLLLIKSIGAAVGMIVTTVPLYHGCMLIWNGAVGEFFSLGVVVGIGAVVYFLLMKLLKVSEVDMIFSIIIRRKLD